MPTGVEAITRGVVVMAHAPTAIRIRAAANMLILRIGILHFGDVPDANAEDPRWLAHATLLLGRDSVAVGFADHEIREYGVGSSPGGGDIRRPMLAQAAFKRPQQRLAYRRIVGRLDAVSDVAFGERACRRQRLLDC